MELIDKLVAWQKESLSPYCLKECKGSCCKDEVAVPRESLYLFPEARFCGTSYVVGPPCPQWDPETHICKIHEDTLRMPWCQDIPLILQVFPIDEKEEIVLTLDTHCELAFKPDSHPLKKSLAEIAKKYKINTMLTPGDPASTRNHYEPTTENLDLAEQIIRGAVRFSASRRKLF